MIDDAARMLGVSLDASVAEIKKRYRLMAIQTHPDAMDRNSSSAMAELNKAYELLKSRAEVREEVEKERTAPEPKVRFNCELCRKKVRVPLHALGKKCKCPHCTNHIDVPTHQIIRCQGCGRKNSVPYTHQKQAVCCNCFAILHETTN